ncbi:MAG: hypothetical protein H6670_02035 [Anaerolineaceae bacterium]|nr:hypothetical protein [Anaerolineaceae bacterium]
MDLFHYIRLLRKWIWLLALVGFVVGSYAYITTISAPPIYNAKATISVGNFLDVQNPTTQDIYTGIALADTYAQILRTPNLHRAVIDELSLNINEATLNSLVSTEIIENTSLLDILVTYVDPIQAADIANELARQLILQSPTNLTEEQRLQITSLNERITAQSTDLQSLRDQLSEVEDDLRDTTLTDDRRTSLQNERTTLVNQINEANANIATYTNTLANIQQRTNSIEIVQEALVPTSPIGRNVIGRVITLVIAALVVTFSIILALDFFRDTFENSEDVSRTLNLPVLGVISRFKKAKAAYRERLITELPQLSQIPEEYRMLRTNLLYALQDKRTVVISSSLPEEGKTVSAANLALSIAQAGLRVVLVDADLRRPRLHEAFELSNDFGLTNLLSNQPVETDRVVVQQNGGGRGKTRVPTMEDWRQVAQPTPHENLTVISSGFIPLNPTEILGSIMIRRWTEAILNSGADFVIFDTPPVLVASDAAVLASRLGVPVMLLVNASKTRKGSVIEAVQRFNAVDVNVAGVLLNRADPKLQTYYGYSYTYYYRNN